MDARKTVQKPANRFLNYSRSLFLCLMSTPELPITYSIGNGKFHDRFIRNLHGFFCFLLVAHFALFFFVFVAKHSSGGVLCGGCVCQLLKGTSSVITDEIYTIGWSVGRSVGAITRGPSPINNISRGKS